MSIIGGGSIGVIWAWNRVARRTMMEISHGYLGRLWFLGVGWAALVVYGLCWLLADFLVEWIEWFWF